MIRIEDLPRESQCVYAIENTVNGCRYIGSTFIGLRARWRGHLLRLTRGDHYNKALQRDWDQYGSDAFQIVILESVPDKIYSCWDAEELRNREQYHLTQTLRTCAAYNKQPAYNPDSPSNIHRRTYHYISEQSRQEWQDWMKNRQH